MGRKQRQAYRLVKSVIDGGNIDVKFSSENVSSGVPECEDLIDTYNIYVKKGDFFNGAPKWLAVISLAKIDGPFFTDFELHFNHKNIELPDSMARKLYENIQARSPINRTKQTGKSM